MTTAVFYNSLFLEHRTGRHPECPDRLVAVERAIDSAGLRKRLLWPSFVPATFEDLQAIHQPQYIRQVESLSSSGGGYLDLDTPLSPLSFPAAMLAAGAVTAAVDAVLESGATNSFALVRPPGHHATHSRGMGFCLFNNVAVAVRRALLSRGLSRVLIVDYDVHHGNGTQDAFVREPSVLYFSTHEYPFYPGTGAVDEVGIGEGSGYTVNVPLPAGVGDAGYARVFDEILGPVAERFRPELIVASAGFDCHWADPIGRMALSVAGLASMARYLVGLADRLCEGRIAFALEGGYALPALGASVVATLQVLLGDEAVDPLGPAGQAEVDASAVISRVKKVHAL